MYTITECNEVEFKTFFCIASKLLYFHISNSDTVKSCFTLVVGLHICIFSESVNLLFLFDSVAFCSVSLSLFPACLRCLCICYVFSSFATTSRKMVYTPTKIRSFPRQYTLFAKNLLSILIALLSRYFWVFFCAMLGSYFL